MRQPLGLLLVLLAAGPGLVSALPNNTAGGAAQFLQLGAGARALGMGEAYGPVADGVDAIYWNPAGLAALTRSEATYTRQEFLRFFHHDFVAYARPVRFLGGVMGMSLTRLSQDSLPLVDKANVTIGQFSPHSEAVAFSYARAFAGEAPEARDREYFRDNWTMPGTYRPLRHELDPWSGAFMLGLSLKLINENIFDRNSTAFAVDGGALYRPVDLEDLSMSAVLRNVGTPQKFISQSENLPLEFDLGIAYRHRFNGSHLLPAVEAAFPYYGNPFVKLGVEYRTPVAENITMSMRGGYKTQTAYDLSPLTGLTAGFGVGLRKLDVDFGFQPLAELGQVYRISLGFRW